MDDQEDNDHQLTPRDIYYHTISQVSAAMAVYNRDAWMGGRQLCILIAAGGSGYMCIVRNR